MRSLLERESSFTLFWSSEFTVSSSSLVDCCSSLDVSSSSLVLWSSSLVDCISSLVDLSSSFEVSSSSIVACRYSFADFNSCFRLVICEVSFLVLPDVVFLFTIFSGGTFSSKITMIRSSAPFPAEKGLTVRSTVKKLPLSLTFSPLWTTVSRFLPIL